MGKPSDIAIREEHLQENFEPQTCTLILTSVIIAFLILFPWLLKGFRGLQTMTYRAIL